MSEEEKVVEGESPEGAAGSKGTVTEEFKVQAQDLFKTINDLIREGTVRRITVERNGRTLVDVPLVLGVPAGVVMAIYMPVLSAVVGIGALLTGCTVRVERDEPSQ